MNKTALVLAGFPCTQFSIAQKKNRIASVDFTAEEFNTWRRITPEWWLHISEFEKITGDKLNIPDYKFEMGLQLFFNCLIAVEKLERQGYKVNYLFENVSSMNKVVKQTLIDIVGGYHIEINSALVSAQNRKRIYFTNFEVKEQPLDRGIILSDILETGESWLEKAYTLDANYFKASNFEVKTQAGRRNMVAEPIRIGTIENNLQDKGHDSKQYRVYSPYGKATTLCGQGGGVGAKTGLYACPVGAEVLNLHPSGHGMNGAVIHTGGKSRCLTTNKGEGQKIIQPVCLRYERTETAKKLRKQYEAGEIKHGFNQYRILSPRIDGKTNTLTTVQKDNMIAVPIHFAGKIVGRRKNASGHRADNDKSIDYVQMIEINNNPQKTNCMTTVEKDNIVMERILWPDGKTYPVYTVKDGLITIKGEQYPIRLPDGYYIIRKLTVIECCRLQTLRDDYCRAVSKSQGYKCLGNGWTADVISHILQYADIPKDEPLTVVSLYDGISTGRYVLDQMGHENITYNAYEIDKYAKQVSASNYPDIIQHGDAMQVRRDDWMKPKPIYEVIDDDVILEVLEQLSIAI